MLGALLGFLEGGFGAWLDFYLTRRDRRGILFFL